MTSGVGKEPGSAAPTRWKQQSTATKFILCHVFKLHKRWRRQRVPRVKFWSIW
jgi:hypothetical protein